jgi:mono/diheme cytochrome c family protein
MFGTKIAYKKCVKEITPQVSRRNFLGKLGIYSFLASLIFISVLVVAAEQDPKKVALGRKTFEDYSCYACHGREGKGGVKNPNAIGGLVAPINRVADSFTRKELKKKILDGVPVVQEADSKKETPPLVMPTWEEILSDEQIEAVIEYLINLMPEEEKDEW